MSKTKPHFPNENVKLVQVKLLKEEDGSSKGRGFVEFTTHNHALAALRDINNNPEIYGKERRPIVQFAIDDVRKLRVLKKSQEVSKQTTTAENNNNNKGNKNNNTNQTHKSNQNSKQAGKRKRDENETSQEHKSKDNNKRPKHDKQQPNGKNQQPKKPIQNNKTKPANSNPPNNNNNNNNKNRDNRPPKRKKEDDVDSTDKLVEKFKQKYANLRPETKWFEQ